jgi:hypothetical protein
MGRDEEWIWRASVIAGIAIAWALLLSLAVDYPARPSGSTSIKALFIAVAIGASWRSLRYLFGLWKADVEHPFSRIRADIRPAVIGFIPVVLGITIVGSFFYSITFLKSMIVAVVPFWADPSLAFIDRAISVDPAKLAKLLEPGLAGLGLFYGLWHVMHIGGILWVLHWRDREKSIHIISFMLTWLIGMTLAFAFSSAGPIFTGQYDPALAPDSVQRAAKFLWANYQAKGALLGGGISAFPSMHVAIAVWFALVLRDRQLPLFGIFYAFAVFVCSIVLGWHYVADGVAGGGVAIAANRLARGWLRQGPAIHSASLTAAATN